MGRPGHHGTVSKHVTLPRVANLHGHPRAHNLLVLVPRVWRLLPLLATKVVRIRGRPGGFWLRLLLRSSRECLGGLPKWRQAALLPGDDALGSWACSLPNSPSKLEHLFAQHCEAPDLQEREATWPRHVCPGHTWRGQLGGFCSDTPTNLHRGDQHTLPLLLASLTSRRSWLLQMHSAPTRATPLARLSHGGSSPATVAVPQPNQRDVSGRNQDVPEERTQNLHPLLLRGDT